MRCILFALSLILAQVAPADVAPRAGWVVLPTGKDHAHLLADLKTAVSDNGMGVVTEAGPTGVARSRGINIPENTVVGVFNNDFAVKVLATSTAAMIEAPIRFYVTEAADGTATLSYKTPSFVLAPYRTEGGPDLVRLGEDLDSIFARIAEDAAQ